MKKVRICPCCNKAPGTVKIRKISRYSGDGGPKGGFQYLCQYDYNRYMWGQQWADQVEAKRKAGEVK